MRYNTYHRNNSKELVAVCQFLFSASSRKPITDTNHRTGFQQKYGKIISQLSAVSSLQREPCGNG
jgi:hypothetical protein